MMMLLLYKIFKLCWLARESCRAMLIVLLNEKKGLHSKRENILRLLYRVVNSENQHLWLFWVAEMSSDDGKKVLDKYGGGGMAERIICLVPSLGSNAAFVGEISETDLDAQDVAFVQLLERARNLTHDLTLEREQQEHWRAERALQEKELRESERSDQREALNVIHKSIY
ncbi:uncharacterized protein [Montipora capricornis]|uniref:uncharacterized protein n=1 Tax=Montipora capricornis TaxID=246305 RepID=UPI0035F16C39